MTNNNPVFNVRPVSGYQDIGNQTVTKIVFGEHNETERGSSFDLTNNRFVEYDKIEKMINF